MKRIKVSALCVTAMIITAGCGDNKTTEKLIGTDVLTATSSTNIGGTTVSSPVQTSAATTAQFATMSAKAVAPTGFFLAPSLYRVAPPSYDQYLTGPDSSGYYTYPDTSFSGSTIKIKFMDASGDTIIFANLSGAPAIDTLNILINSTYQGGTYAGDFTVDWSTTPAVLDNGTITATVSNGITFTAVITAMTFEKTTTTLGIPIGLPISGSMVVSSPSGWGGVLAYNKSGSSYVCTGTISENGEARATVSLTYNVTFGNYSGSYVDLNTGETHLIQ